MANVYLAMRYAGLAVEPELKESAGIQRDSDGTGRSPYVNGVGKQNARGAEPRSLRSLAARNMETERRKISRRIQRRSVLVDLRSGRNRRRRHQRESDLVVHIDELV